MLMTVIELPEYINRSESLLEKSECSAIIDYLAEHPKAGQLIVGTGGIRKLRWSRGHKGKSGGVRVIYYFYDERIPLYLLTVFGKGERANLPNAERKTLAFMVRQLVAKVLEKNDDKCI